MSTITRDEVIKNPLMFARYCNQELRVPEIEVKGGINKKFQHGMQEEWIQDALSHWHSVLEDKEKFGLSDKFLKRMSTEEVPKMKLDEIIGIIAEELKKTLITNIYNTVISKQTGDNRKNGQKYLLRIAAANGEYFTQDEVEKFRGGIGPLDGYLGAIFSFLSSLKSALENAVDEFCGLLGVIPKVYKREKQHDINQEEYQSIFNNCKYLVGSMAKMHIDIFNTMKYGILKVGTGLQHLTHDQYFTLKNLNGAVNLLPTMELLDKVLEQGQALGEITTPAYGCPALRIIGTTNKPIIEEVRVWIEEVLEKVFFPYIDQILRN